MRAGPQGQRGGPPDGGVHLWAGLVPTSGLGKSAAKTERDEGAGPASGREVTGWGSGREGGAAAPRCSCSPSGPEDHLTADAAKAWARHSPGFCPCSVLDSIKAIYGN